MLIVVALLGGLFNAAVIAAFLLVPAGLVPGGTWYWWQGLWFAVGLGVVNSAGSVVLAVLRPASFRVRMQGLIASDERQPLADKIATGVLAVTFFAWLAFIPCDVFWWRLLPPPPFGASLLGAGIALAGVVVMIAALFQNEFAAPNVQDQSARTQRVIDSGLYGIVRHPMYSGALMLFPGTALWLQSYAALIASAVFIVILLARIAVEECHLRAHLPGYTEYAVRVRARLVPGCF